MAPGRAWNGFLPIRKLYPDVPTADADTIRPAAIGMVGVGGFNSLAVRRSATARPVHGRDLRVCCREGRRAWPPGASQGPVDQV
jgi:hypothetical protein